MRVVQQDQRLMIGLPADRPNAAQVPIGSMFFATDTNETFIAVDGRWHSMLGQVPASDPLETIRPMNPQRRFKYTCRGSYPGQEHNHDSYDFFWDGIRNIADRKSIEIASMYDELAGYRKKCSKCGSTLEGGEIYQTHLPDLPPADESQALRELKNLSENLHTVHQQIGDQLSKLNSIEDRLNRMEGKVSSAAPTIEDYIAFLRRKHPFVDEKFIQERVQDVAAGRRSINDLHFSDDATRELFTQVANAERDRMLAIEPKTLLEKLRAKAQARADLEQQNALADRARQLRLTEEEKLLLQQQVAPALAGAGSSSPIEVWPRQMGMAANFGFDLQRLFAMAENMTNDKLTPLTHEEIIALRNRINAPYPPEAVTPATEDDNDASLKQQLLDRLSPYRGESGTYQGAIETLERIIQERNQNRPATPTERTIMTEESKMKKIGKTLKANAGEAAWRVGAAQATRTAKAAVVAGVLKTVPKTEKALRKQLVAFFDTAYGDAVVGLLLSGAISMTGAPEGSKRDKLAEELRVGAMSVAANEALNGLLDPLRGFMMGGLDAILEGMPEPEAVVAEKVRVDASTSAEPEEEEAEASGARARATA